MVPIEMTELRQKKCSCRQRCDRISVHTEQAETGRHVRDRWLFIKATRAPGVRNRKATKKRSYRHWCDSISVQSEQAETVG